jgi:hypothetical protein
MLCCAGLFGGLAVGQYLGGPWTVIAPAAGFGIGMMADMTLMKGCHLKGGQHHAGSTVNKEAVPVELEADEPGADAGVRRAV